jgi:hypothetical protein
LPGPAYSLEESSAVKRLGKRAGDEAWKNYHRQRKTHNLSAHCVTMIRGVCAVWDTAGATTKILVPALDGSFCNRTVFGADPERIELIARARKDAVLCLRAPQGTPRF